MADGKVLDVHALVVAQGWRIRRVLLVGKDGDGMQAGICPSPTDEFTISVDDAPGARDAAEVALLGNTAARQVLERSRVAHELGHTFFYRTPDSGQDAPSRLAPPTQEEERFCDRFAACLLIPPVEAERAVKSGAQAVLDAAIGYRCPVSTVLESSSVARAILGRLTLDDSGGGWLAEPQATWELSDSAFAWREEPTLLKQLTREADHFRETCGFLALAGAEVSVLVAPSA